MIKIHLQILLFLLLPTFIWAQPCREVIAFYPSWKWYDRGRLVNPATIDYSKYTAINYAFFQPGADGSVSPFDPRADKTLLLGEIYKEAPPGYAKGRGLGKEEWHRPGTSLVDRAHEAGVKVFISVGGWTMSGLFSGISADPGKRRRFAHACNQLIRTYRIDGIDIDWEYPKARDTENFTLLLQAVRDSLDFCEAEMEKKLSLTADFGAGETHASNIDWPRVAPLLDLMNVMTYDYYGSTPGRTNHHSPLFAPQKGVAGYDLHSTVRNLLGHGVPAAKINIGLAFFGRSLKTKGRPKLHSPSHRKTDKRTFADGKGAPSYYQILASQKKFDAHWDDFAQVPYLAGRGSLHTFVTYDDERSIALKAQYILDHNLAGAIVWDLTGDYVESGRRPGTIAATPLADALKEGLCRQAETLACVEGPGPISKVEELPVFFAEIEKRSYPPRVVLPPKKLSRKERRKLRKRKRRERKNRTVPGRYFDGGW